METWPSLVEGTDLENRRRAKRPWVRIPPFPLIRCGLLSGQCGLQSYTGAVSMDDYGSLTKAQLLDIKVEIIDEDALMAPSPERSLAYLMDHGWECLTKDGEKPAVWGNSSHGEAYEVIHPSSKHYLDYPRRMADLVRTLSIVEDRSELAVWHDLVSP